MTSRAPNATPVRKALWWAEDMAAFSLERRDEWLWRAVILQPDFITQALMDSVIYKLVKSNAPA